MPYDDSDPMFSASRPEWRDLFVRPRHWPAPDDSDSGEEIESDEQASGREYPDDENLREGR